MQKNVVLLLLLAVFSLFGCNKPDPTPHLHDEIYADMQAQKGEAATALAGAEKDLKEAKEGLDKVAPQTGQIKYARKRIYDAETKVNTYQQQVRYWEVRIAEREKYVKRAYLEKFKKGEKWENHDELKQYMLEKKFRQQKMGWDAKERIKQYQEQNAPPKPAAGGGH